MTEPQSKLPWWVAARSRRAALMMGVGYSVLCVSAMGLVISGASPWCWGVAACALIVAVLEWVSFSYFQRQRR